MRIDTRLLALVMAAGLGTALVGCQREGSMQGGKQSSTGAPTQQAAPGAPPSKEGAAGPTGPAGMQAPPGATGGEKSGQPADQGSEPAKEKTQQQ